MSIRAVIFDRDGVLIEDSGFPHKSEHLRWMPGAVEAVAALNRADILVLVATNQSGIARGYFDEATMHRFHEVMQFDLARSDAEIDAFYFCPYLDDAIVPAYRHADHPDRKPNPGMVLRALSDWRLAPDEAVLIGDRETDMEAARRAGVRGVLYSGGDLKALTLTAISR